MTEDFSKKSETERNRFMFAVLLVCATLVAYLPVWRAGFIWDDDTFLYSNPLIRRSDGLYLFWFTRAAPDYFPLTSSMLWVEWRLWGPHPLGYHLVNLLLHTCSSLVLWRVLARLRIPGSWLAGILFAVHPVNVESVAWITERKNTLAMLFFLLSVFWYLQRKDERGAIIQSSRFILRRPAWRHYGGQEVQGSRFSSPLYYLLSFVAFVLALLSKTAVAPLPIVLLLCAWWKENYGQYAQPATQDLASKIQNPESKTAQSESRFNPLLSRFTFHVLRFTPLVSRLTAHLFRLAPFLIASVLIGLVSLWFQYHRAIGPNAMPQPSMVNRVAGAGWAIWFYLSKALLPLNLIFVYPHWTVNGQNLLAWVPWLLLSMVLMLCWRSRKTCGGAALFALLYFLLMVSPVLGFLRIYFMRYSTVSDHWQYFAIIGPIALCAAALNSCFKFQTPAPGSYSPSATRSDAPTLKRPHAHSFAHPLTAPFLSALLLAALGVLTFHQCLIYSNSETLWEATLAANPKCAMAQVNLSLIYLDRGQFEEGFSILQKTIADDPTNPEAQYNLGNLLLKKGERDQAIARYRKAIELRPRYPDAHYNLANVLWETHDGQQAIAEYRKAIEAWPEFVNAHYNLANVLAFTGSTDEALVHYRWVLRIEPAHAQAHLNSARVLLQKGAAAEAIVHYRQALRLDARFASDPRILGDLSAAYAQTGELQAASKTVLEALDFAEKQNNPALADQLRRQLASYRSSLPLEKGRSSNPQ